MANSAASRLVLGAYSERGVIETARQLLDELGGKVTCGFVFASADYGAHLPDFLELIQLHGHVPMLSGCSGSGLIGTGTEEEQGRGFSLLLLHLPDTGIFPFHFSAGQAEELDSPEVWRTATGLQPDQVDAWIVLANPLTFPVEPWLTRWSSAYPGIPCLGGLGSAGQDGEEIFVFHNRAPVEGVVAIGLRGGVRIETLVSQGCRPIGQPFTITGAEQNFIITLGSRPAYQVLAEVIEGLSGSERRRASGNLFAGLAMSEYVDDFKTGDFLVRNLIGADANHGVVAIGAHPRVGQTMQFQLRDRLSADEELRHLTDQKLNAGIHPFASLLFACAGRGRHLFGEPNHDAAALTAAFGPKPSAGFFCNGEIGPVSGRNFVHGYTASAALFVNG